MAKRNGYNVTAFDTDGDVILIENVSSKVTARKLAREFLAYSNVKSADIDNAFYGNSGNIIEQYIKIGISAGVCIADGHMTNIRF